MDIGARIREIRKAMKLSQIGLAKRAGVSQPTISKYETDPSTEHKAEILFRIAAALEVTPEYLKTGHGPVKLQDLKADQKELLAVIDRMDDSTRAPLLSVAKSML